MESQKTAPGGTTRTKTIDLAVRANCQLTTRGGGALEFRFPPREGFLTPARWEFRDRGELVEYLARLLSLEVTGGALRGAGVRYGKYERRAPDGGRAFTFGDPLLDLITDPAGGLVIGGRRIDLAAVELSSPRQRAGGLRSVDLGPFSGAVRDLQVAQAAAGQGDFTLVECSSEFVALASTNPSRRDYYRNGDHLRFRAWKKNYTLYWSMGAEVETWGHDFNRARVESRYLDTFAGPFCATVKVDSDEDTNDDHVDEYEWGVNSPQPLRVVSLCSADWHGLPFAGQVEAGTPCTELKAGQAGLRGPAWPAVYNGPTIEPPIQSRRAHVTHEGPIRVAIVGYGSAGRRFHPYLIGRVPELRLVAVATRSAERRAQAEAQLGVPTFETVDDLLARAEVDLAVVATPHDTHKDLACKVLEAQTHCVVEKIMALDAAGARRMVEAAERTGVLLSVFQNRRWDWDFLTVQRAIAEGLLGAPFLFEVGRFGYRAQGGWRGEKAVGGGLLFDWGAHFVDQALQLVPAPVVSVTCDIQYRGWGSGIGSYARLLLRFANDVLYSIEISNLARYAKPHWVVLGEKGALVKSGFDPQEQAMLAGDIEAAQEDPANRARVTTQLGAFTSEIILETVRSDWTSYYRNIADALRGRADLIVTPEQALRAMEVVDAAMESARTGQAVRVTEAGR